MREQIEQLIEWLNEQRKANKAESYKDGSTATSAYYEGITVDLLMARDKLKAVLHETGDTRNPANHERDHSGE